VLDETVPENDPLSPTELEQARNAALAAVRRCRLARGSWLPHAPPQRRPLTRGARAPRHRRPAGPEKAGCRQARQRRAAGGAGGVRRPPAELEDERDARVLVEEAVDVTVLPSGRSAHATR
jgi:phenylalanyl-tRNA synthetase alpha chain